MTRKCTLFVVVITLSGTAFAKDNLQIAFVDSFKAMRDCKDGQVVGKELDAMRDKFSKEIQQEAQKIAKEEADLKAKIAALEAQASALKPEAYAREQQSLAKDDRHIKKMKEELQEGVRDKEETIKVVMQQKTEELAGKIEEGIITVAKEKGVDAVIDKMTGRVMYTKEDNTGDITTATIACVDKKSILIAAGAGKKDEKIVVAGQKSEKSKIAPAA